jgi:protein phosphatase 1G
MGAYLSSPITDKVRSVGRARAETAPKRAHRRRVGRAAAAAQPPPPSASHLILSLSNLFAPRPTPTAQASEEGGDGRFAYGACGMQGWRTDMEDAHLAALDVRPPAAAAAGGPPTAVFAVFDGHGGKEVARFAAAHLPSALTATAEYAAGDLEAALVRSFFALDEMIQAPEHRAELFALRDDATEGDGSGAGDGAGGSSRARDAPGTMTVSSAHLPDALREALGMPGDRPFSLRFVKGADGRMEIDDVLEDGEEGEEEEDEEEAEEGGAEDAGAAAAAPGEEAAAPAGAPDKEGSGSGKRQRVHTGAGASAGGANGAPAFAADAAAGDDDDDPVEAADGPLVTASAGPDDAYTPSAGCTAVAALVRGAELVVANAGDSRAVLSRRGVAVPLTRDHKPTDADEFARITRAGGFVADGRVNGSLNLSRALGDMEYKTAAALPPAEQAVTALPEMRREALRAGDEFLILACDGIWDVWSHQDAVDFARARLAAGEAPRAIAEAACDACLAPDTQGCGKGCDNMSFMLVMLKDFAEAGAGGGGAGGGGGGSAEAVPAAPAAP